MPHSEPNLVGAGARVALCDKSCPSLPVTEHDPGRPKPAAHLESWNSDLESEEKARKSCQLSALPGKTWGLLNSKTQFPAFNKSALKSEGVDPTLKNSVSPITHWSAQVSGTHQSPYSKYFSSKKEEEHREACMWDLVCSVCHDTTASQLSVPIWSYSQSPQRTPHPSNSHFQREEILAESKACVNDTKKTFPKSDITETASPLWNPRACLSLGFRFKRLPHTNLSFFYPWAFKCHGRMDSVTAHPALQTTQTAAVHINSRSRCPERNWVTTSECGFLSV